MRIVCATDLTPNSDAAVERAGHLASQLDAELIILHAVPHSSSASALERSLGEAAERMKARTRSPRWVHALAPNTMVRIGVPASLLCEVAEGFGADLIVMGPHARATRDGLTGTVATRVLSERRWPVLIARQRAHGPYQDVLLALDRTPESAAVIRAAESLVLRDAASASIVHSCRIPYSAMLDSAGVPRETIADFPGMVTTQARDDIRELLARESDGSIEYNVNISRAPPAKAIGKAARRLQPDLIVMGTRGHGPVRRALLGSVATQIVGSVMSDVLVVPERKTAATRRTRQTGREIAAARPGLHGEARASRHLMKASAPMR